MQATDRFYRKATLGTAGLLVLLLTATLVMGQPPAPLPAMTGAATPGVKATVGEVRVVGNTSTPAERILYNVRTKPGGEFNQSVIAEDVRTIFTTQLFRDVQVEVRQHLDNPNIVDIYFRVVERQGMIREIIYNGGGHLKADELKTLTRIRKGDPMNPGQNQLACQAIVESLVKDGYPFASCELAEGKSPTDTRVVFNITQGKKIRVKHVEFVGQTFVSGERLRTQTKTTREFLDVGGTLNLFMVDYDVKELTDYYKSHGFQDVRVSRELKFEPDGDHVDVVFHILEGPRYRVAGRPQVDFIANNAPRQLPEEVVRAIPRLGPGEWYEEDKVKVDVQAITEYYGRTGRDVRVEAVPFHDPNTPGLCQVRYEVRERPPAKVGYIYYVGNDVTRTNVLQRAMPEGLAPGQTLQWPDLRTAERNLQRLGIFKNNPETGEHPTVEVLNRYGDEDWKDILVRVQEDKTGSLMFGVGVNSDTSLSGSIVLNERNFDITRFPTSFDDFLSGRAFRGAGQDFRLEAVPGTQVQRYSATWTDPMLFDSPYSLTVSTYYWEQIYNEYTESRLGERITVGRRLNQYWTANASLRIEDVGVHDVPPWGPVDYQSVDGNHFLLGAGAGLTRDTRDSFIRATEGNRLILNYEEVTGQFTFPSVNVDFSQYWTLYQRADGSGRHVLAYHGQATWVGPDAPVYERLFAGGFRSMRGFEFRGISPEVDGIAVGGHFMMLNSLEYQIPVTAGDKIWFVVFCDTGTVEESVEIKNYRVAVGAGVRFVVPMLGPMPIALDFGFPIVKADGDQTQVFSFWVGFMH